jgi:1-acyl-sn-glycerol-3-phosphate acyltransferase
MGYINSSFDKMQRRRGALTTALERAYGVAGWLVFVVVAFALVGVVSVLPGEARRRAAARTAARVFLAATAARPAVSGLHHIPATPCIVAANHASYMDGVILSAALPPRFGFVIKREMTRVPVVHFLLRRLGSQFVERFDTRRGATDARRILGLAESRHSLAFFPEGTFRPEPGLRRFQSGAFAAAVRGNLPIVPVVIRGSRHMLAADRWLPRPARLEVIVKPAVHHNGAEDAVAALLGDCRRAILEDLAEPDLLAGRR